MSTYLNCYEIVSNIRLAINDWSIEKVQGQDTSGSIRNDYILNKINNAQRYIYNFIYNRQPAIFFTTTTISGVNSVYTLPWDFGVLEEFRDENGCKVNKMEPWQMKKTSSTGYDYFYRRQGNTLVLDKAGVTTGYTLAYYTKPRDITMGTCASGSATVFTFGTEAKKINDYYNNLTLENITQDYTDTITDYVGSTRIATVTTTPNVNDYYGIVSELPEPFHYLIEAKAILDITTEHPNAQVVSAQPDMVAFNELLLDTLRTFAGSSRDVDIEDIFCSFEPSPIIGESTVYYGE
jgi:hypothetical protein